MIDRQKDMADRPTGKILEETDRQIERYKVPNLLQLITCLDGKQRLLFTCDIHFHNTSAFAKYICENTIVKRYIDVTFITS